MSEFYDGRQFVGMDLHRRRSVLVRMSETGEHLETVRILNDRDVLAEVMSRAGESPEVVLEATYGWYWAADALAELGATVHLAHPLAPTERKPSLLDTGRGCVTAVCLLGSVGPVGLRVVAGRVRCAVGSGRASR